MNNDTVIKIAKNLNKTSSKWGIGGSRLLAQHGLVDVVNDLDIIIAKQHVEEVINELRLIGNELTVKSLDPYQTTFYYEFNILDLSVDVMGEFKISHDNGVYVLPFEEHCIEYHIINGVEVPFCTLEDWYILYQLIPGRELKVDRIERFFIENGIKHPKVLKQSLGCSLPKNVRTRIQNIVANSFIRK